LTPDRLVLALGLAGGTLLTLLCIWFRYHGA